MMENIENEYQALPGLQNCMKEGKVSFFEVSFFKLIRLDYLTIECVSGEQNSSR